MALSRHAGLMLDEWQELVLVESLGMDQFGNWVTFEEVFVVPRQNGKGAVIEARQLAALFLTKDPQVIYSAHKFKTAKAMYRRIRELIKTTPDLHKLVQGYRQSNEETAIVLADSRLDFFARSTGAGRGFTGDTMFFDEAFDLNPEMLADTLPTLSAVRNPQVWYVSSAGMPASEALRAVRQRGIDGDPRVMLAEWSVPLGADLDDRDNFYLSNPGAGIRVKEDFVYSVERPGMPDDEAFGRERFGIWTPSSKKPRLIPAQAWTDTEDGSSEVIGPLVFGVASGLDREWSSIAVCGANRDGVPHVELVARNKGISWVSEWLVERNAMWAPEGVFLDSSEPTSAATPALDKNAVAYTALGTREVVTGAGLLLDKVTEGSLAHPLGRDQPEVLAAFANAAKRPIGDFANKGGFGLGRIDPEIDISAAVAIQHALYGWLTRKPKRTGKVW